MSELYPTIPEATDEELSADLDADYLLAAEAGELGERDALIVAAHHARRADDLERRVAELEEKARTADVLERFREFSARHPGRYQLFVESDLYVYDSKDDAEGFWTGHAGRLVTELSSWLDEQEGKTNADSNYDNLPKPIISPIEAMEEMLEAVERKLAERDATIAELREALSRLADAARESRPYRQCVIVADALLAKTAPAKEGT